MRRDAPNRRSRRGARGPTARRDVPSVASLLQAPEDRGGPLMSLTTRPVSDVMQREVVTLRADDRLDLADDIMRLGRVRHLPVLEGERLVGILSNRDLLAASLSKALNFDPKERRTFMRSVDVREVMTKEVATVGPDLPLIQAARLMIRRRFGCLPVVNEGGALIGLLTETDLLR